MKKKFIVIFGLICLAILLFFVFKNDNEQVACDKNTARVSEDTASASGNTAPKIKTMYRNLEFNGDTTVWDSTDCVIRDSSFSCKKVEIIDHGKKLLELLGKQTQKNNEKPLEKDIYQNLNFGMFEGSL